MESAPCKSCSRLSFNSSGSRRSGVFCALSIVVERMRAEGVVDLLQTVRQLREQRPQMVETLEEYAFCYEAALQYR